jgi:hypothetical protein
MGICAGCRSPERASQVLQFSPISQSRCLVRCKMGLNISSRVVNCQARMLVLIPIFSYQSLFLLSTVLSYTFILLHWSPSCSSSHPSCCNPCLSYCCSRSVCCVSGPHPSYRSPDASCCRPHVNTDCGEGH